MNLKIAVVEDDIAYQNEIAAFIKKYQETSYDTFDVSCFNDGIEITDNYQQDWDIILLDIEMKFQDGLETARKIRQFDKKVVLIFITNSPQYAIKGYSVEALNYILKPIGYFAFSEELKHAIDNIRKTKDFFVSINSDGRVLVLKASEIYFIESVKAKHKLFIKTKSNEYYHSGTLKNMEKLLDGHHFSRCNNSCLINLARVKGFDTTTVTVGVDQISISRPRRKEFLSVLTTYFEGKYN